MLEVEKLSVRYGAVHAVRGVSLDVSVDQLVGLLGPNGAGKTSLLRAVSGLAPYSGRVRFDGTDLAGRVAERIARMGLVHVPEGRHVFPSLSVQENMLLGRLARGRRRSTFELEDVFGLFPALRQIRGRGGWALSGGEQQMVAIGRALMGAPRMLLLDEPSLGLAPKMASTVMSALQRVRGEVAILVVEQNTALALNACDRAYVQVEGEVVLSGTAAELGDRKTLLDSFLGQRIDVRPSDVTAQPDAGR
jgi:branched-chain amino acid transport system ATP-binding protein